MPTIKKIGNIVFTVINTIVIISLLVFSTILILSVNSNSPSILGFSSKLIFDRTNESAMLVISQTSSKLSANDEFVFITAEGVGIYTADTVEENMIMYRGLDNSISSAISIESPEYGGKVLIKNAGIGGMLSTLVKTESMAVVYVLIIGTFSLLLLLLFLVHYLLKNKDKLVEYYEEVEEIEDNELGEQVSADMQEDFDEIPEVIVSNERKTKAKGKKSKNKKSKTDKDADVLDLIEGIDKNPNNPPSTEDLKSLSNPASRKRATTSKTVAMPASRYGDNVASYELEITEDSTTLLDDAFLPQSTLDSMYSDDDILAVLTEPNATFVVEDDDEEEYYEDGNVKYFGNGADKPSLQESLMAYVHTDPDMDPEPPLPMAKTNDGIPIEWFESILEVANEDPRLPEVLLEDFEIKPVQIEEPLTSAKDIINRVEEMSTFKRQHPSGNFTVVSNPTSTSNEKPSADSLLQEIDSIVQKPEEPVELHESYELYQTQEFTDSDIPPAPTNPMESLMPELDQMQEQQYG